METFSVLLAICGGNSPVPGEFPAQRPVTRSFDVFFDLRCNKQLSKQSWGWWYETLSCPLWRHSNEGSVSLQFGKVLITGFIAVREMSGRNKISQGQGIVREFYQLSGKFWHWAKLMKNVMEFHIMSGKMTILDDVTLQSPHISIN